MGQDIILFNYDEKRNGLRLPEVRITKGDRKDLPGNDNTFLAGGNIDWVLLSEAFKNINF
jgi:hypothetical protein